MTIERVRAVIDAATPGPWVVFDDERPGIDSADESGPNVIYAGRFANGGYGGGGRAADARAIVLAHDLAPEWLALWEAADGKLEAMQATMRRFGAVVDKWPPKDRPEGGWTPETAAALDRETFWQGMFFSVYTDLAEITERARALDAKAEEVLG